MQQLQGNFNGYQAQITAWVDKTKKDNGLGDDVEYDPAQDKWFRLTKSAKTPDKPAAPAHAPVADKPAAPPKK